MTDREIKRAEKALPGWENGKPPVRNEEQERIAEELNCRGMINSILIYYGPGQVQEGSYNYREYLKEYEQVLGRETVARLCGEQIGDFQKAVVSPAGYDSEGVYYNSIKWADEMVDECLKLIEEDLSADGPENGTGYTLPDGKYHIYAYVDEIDDEKVVVLEPNKVIDGAHEPIFGDTFISSFRDVENIRRGIDWCLSEFVQDKYGLDAVLNAAQRSCASRGEGTRKEELRGAKSLG